MSNRGSLELGVFLLLCSCLSACGGGTYQHYVRPGETLSSIGQRYGIPYQDIARLNRLRDPDKIYVGQRLQIPRNSGAQTVAVEPSTRSTSLPPLFSDESVHFPQDEFARFAWPLREGRVTSGFGLRNGRFHDGIDISAPPGTAVLAAAGGQVIFSDALRGYGKVVIIRHSGGYITIYAHNSRNRVHDGQFVRRGQRVADVGSTGRVTGPHLHFEIRKNNLARNPLPYLPWDRRTVQRSR